MATTEFNAPASFAPLWQRVYTEIGRVIVGQQPLLERLLAALIADGHVLLEGVPGLAKTKLLHALSTCISATMHRVQFTPDVLRRARGNV